MSVLLLDLSAELAAAAEREALRSTRRRRRGRWAATIAIALLGTAGAAAATGTFFWQPRLGNESQGHPSASASGAPAAQLELLGVLRRPQTDADRGAAARYAARWLGTEFRGVRTNSIRVLPNGSVLFTAEEGPGGRDSVCLFLADEKEAGGYTCVGTEALRTQGAEIITMPAPNIRFRMKDGHVVTRDGRPVPLPGSHDTPQPSRVIGIAPDGVAAVTFGSTTVPVRDNAYAADLPPGQAPGRTMLGADGERWHGG